MMTLKIFIVICLLCVQLQCSFSQSFSITKVERTGNNIVLHYNLVDTATSRTYTVNVYSSVDDYGAPLQKITGDAGLEVHPGGNHKIVWNAKEELGAMFSGDVRLEVRGKIYVPFVRLDGFDDYKIFKRKKAYKITWTGGRGNSVLNFDLYKGEKKITSFPNVANVGYYNLLFDDVRPGKNYVLRISDSRNKDDVVYSAPFRIKRKVPLLLKVIPLGACAYLFYALSAASGDNEIVDPPLPGN